ncbi:MAG: ornithine cyclodeaminase family protein, partial [Planctomycetota bacterium]
MTTLLISQKQIRALLPMEKCIDLMAAVLRTLSLGDAINPLRWAVQLPQQNGILGLMPGYLGDPKSLGLKVVTIFPGNHGTPYDSHQGVVVLFDVKHGRPIAILDASEITAIRTAATSGVATRALAREDASELALLGSGVQARTHLEAMLRVRNIQRVRVYSPTRSHLEDFVNRESQRQGLRVEATRSAQEAVEGADLICTTTSAREPVIFGEWLNPGAHINAAGACIPTTRELDTAAVLRSRLFVDRLESATHEAGDFLIPVKEGAFGEDHIRGELGEVLLGRR